MSYAYSLNTVASQVELRPKLVARTALRSVSATMLRILMKRILQTYHRKNTAIRSWLQTSEAVFEFES